MQFLDKLLFFSYEVVFNSNWSGVGGSINEMGSIKCYYFPKATLVCLNHSTDYSMPVKKLYVPL